MNRPLPRPLPIVPLLPELLAALGAGRSVVLRAPPGAGKTTRVPAAALDAGVAAGKAILVLEPRRIAARAAAEYVAAERGGEAGGEVGYRVRFESRGGPGTRLWFLTEGVFTRRLLADPYLEEVGLVILDEFHERHLQGDVALGVVRELHDTVRPDLGLVVMSATLETGAVASFLPGSAVLTSEGRRFPVTIEHEAGPSEARLESRVAAALRRVLGATGDGDVLVFLPGAAAIRRTGEAVAGLAEEHGLDVVPLHGDLALEGQRRAILAGPRRKVVLATNVAETALTIEGVTTVIDSGLAREARFDPRHGLNRLEEVRISRAAAEQRAGRAGRTRPGRCIRLWSAADHAGRREREAPEILRLDLSAMVLELRAWGARDLSAFPWLDPPPPAAITEAERLLGRLGALAPDGTITPTGRRMLELPAPPRLGRMLVEAERRGCAADGALLAALAGERDLRLERRALSGRTEAPWPSGPSDLLLARELFLEAAREGLAAPACRRLGLDPKTVRAVDRARRPLARLAGADAGDRSADDETLLRCVLAGFPDRVARRRERGSPRGLMVGGKGVVLDRDSVVREEDFFVAVDVDAGPRRERAEARVGSASAIRPEWLAEMFPGSVETVEELVFDPAGERVVARRHERYLDLVLAGTVTTDVDPARAAPVLAAAALREPAVALSLGEAEQGLLGRIGFLARSMPGLGVPDDPDELLGRLVEGLVPGRRSYAELRRVNLVAALRGLLTRPQLEALDREAPERFRLPSGREAPIAYEPGRAPEVSARIQELFGLAATPRLAGGRVPLLVEVLAPNRRPVQRTDDLASFWARTYPEVRKQLRGRYPRHPWPESPTAADARR